MGQVGFQEQATALHCLLHAPRRHQLRRSGHLLQYLAHGALYLGGEFVPRGATGLRRSAGRGARGQGGGPVCAGAGKHLLQPVEQGLGRALALQRLAQTLGKRLLQYLTGRIGDPEFALGADPRVQQTTGLQRLVGRQFQVKSAVDALGQSGEHGKAGLIQGLLAQHPGLYRHARRELRRVQPGQRGCRAGRRFVRWLQYGHQLGLADGLQQYLGATADRPWAAGGDFRSRCSGSGLLLGQPQHQIELAPLRRAADHFGAAGLPRWKQ